MKNWKVKQLVYHRLHHTFEDSPYEAVMMTDTSDSEIIRVVSDYMSGWIPDDVVYPAKSYFVGLVYARLLRDHFQEDPLVALDDPELLFGNDPHFLPYSEHRAVYDAIINRFGWDFDLKLGEIPDVQDYFTSEFLFD